MARAVTQNVVANFARSGNGGRLGRNGHEDGGTGWPAGQVPQRAYVTGMTMGLCGVLMFFTALVSAYIVRRGMPNAGWRALPEMPRILWLNTLILIASSGALAWSRRRFRAGDAAGFRRWWGLATILGIFFLVGQIVAWRQFAASGVYLATNASNSFFYLFTAAHGLHLAGGIIALVSVLARPTRRLALGTATEVAAMYWHFMDGLWVFLLLLLMVAR
jgi:cytochrome c oxidase subunit III